MLRLALSAVITLGCGCAGSTSEQVAKDARALGANDAPAWLSDLESNVVILSTTFSGESYDAPPQAGSGVIVGLTESTVTILTASHLVLAPQNDLDSLRVRFSVTDSVDVNRPAPSTVLPMGNELAAVTVDINAKSANQLRERVKPIRLGEPAEAIHSGNPTWFMGRCGSESLRTFRLSRLEITDPVEAEFSARNVQLPPGCSGGGIFIDGRLVGLLQRTESHAALATSVAGVLRHLRDVRPHDDSLRNLLEPFGALSFSDVPYRSTYHVNEGPTRPLLPQNLVPSGRSTIEIQASESAEKATASLDLRPDQRLKCQVDFATDTSRFRARYSYIMIGGSAAIVASGLLFLGLAEVASSDFDTTWSRSARDRNHTYSELALWTLGIGAVAVSASTIFAVMGDAREHSTVQCR